ncbi:thiol-disulfide oxidoreductase ResA [Marinicrinis sediminis]|uniref:Thiol-disulfide oxidoreductase ResA n=1 Tax=Marinicrinis sediminis TaxID=1652465 RepID=A0ABW5REN7_9BACL
MKNKKTMQIVILALFVIVGGYTITSGLFKESNPLPQEGKEVPAFELTDLEGNQVSLSMFEGQPVIINFWGTFCEPCVREMPLIEDYYQTYQEDGLVVLGVNLAEPKLRVQTFIEDMGVSFPILMDPGSKTRKDYGVSSFPTTFFVNEQGELASEVIGEMTESTMRIHLSKIMSQPLK